MREIIVRDKDGRLARIEGELFIGEYDQYHNPIFENDYVHVDVETGFGSSVGMMARVEWCQDCRGFHVGVVDELLQERESVFEGMPSTIIKVVTHKSLNAKTS